MPLILSFNAGTAEDRSYPDQVERTAIGKRPLAGRVRLTRLGIVGDQQVDRQHHGGPDRALCAYVADHHPGWVGALGRPPEPGLFGENLTVQGIDETQVHCGDRFRVGSAIIEITTPRIPCMTLTRRLGYAEAIPFIRALGWCGWYNRVIEEGEAEAGDELELIHPDPAGVSIREIYGVNSDKTAPRAALERVLAVRALPDEWREKFQRRILA
ncbi:MAG TPA: MOSC domain-containing protein [Gemmatimonadales bacterium]|nr:MOSC domain-containing protein [Gemmatimonadales bacterium]